MPRPLIDYSLYYVTGRSLLPSSTSSSSNAATEEDFYLEHLEEALQGGVTVVQIREKDVGGRDFLQVAKRSQQVCHKYSIPLIINDRLDIALALQCGLHVGQSDLPAPLARQLLGPDQLLGVSVNTIEELEEVLGAGPDVVDYIGIGPCFGTRTKQDLSPLLGTRGVRSILARLGDSPIKAVVIGGITAETIPNVLAQTPAPLASGSGYRHLDGLAVVSSIASSSDPRAASAALLSQFKASLRYPLLTPNTFTSSESLLDAIVDLIDRLRSTSEEKRPLVHHITNQVVMNDCANLTLAFGCSPIMSAIPAELEQLSTYLGCLLLNLGTATELQIEAQLIAGKAANRRGKLVVFDPVGCGATEYRKAKANQLMSEVQMGVLKGNAGEISALVGSNEVKARGVDSVGKGFEKPDQVVRLLARNEKFTVAMSGPDDYVSNGDVVVKLSNGHEYQGVITGSGCMASTAVASFASLPLLEGTKPNEQAFLAAVTGLTAINVAAELASLRPDVKGPNTFRAALIDECYHLTGDKVRQRAKIQVI